MFWLFQSTFSEIHESPTKNFTVLIVSARSPKGLNATTNLLDWDWSIKLGQIDINIDIGTSRSLDIAATRHFSTTLIVDIGSAINSPSSLKNIYHMYGSIFIKWNAGLAEERVNIFISVLVDETVRFEKSVFYLHVRCMCVYIHTRMW